MKSVTDLIEANQQPSLFSRQLQPGESMKLQRLPQMRNAFFLRRPNAGTYEIDKASISAVKKSFIATRRVRRHLSQVFL